MRKFLPILISLLIASPCFAARNATDYATFEIRSGGNVNNGGGFLDAGTGTDFSEQDAAELSFTDLEIKGGVGTRLYSVANNAVLNDAKWVGNFIHVTGDGGSTVFNAGFYLITATGDDGSEYLDVHESAGANGNDGIAAIGGGLSSIVPASLPDGDPGMIAGDTIYIQKGTITQLSSVNTGLDGTATKKIQTIGYNAVRDDNPTIASGNQPTIACGANTFFVDNYWHLKYLTFTGTANAGLVRADTGSIIEECAANNSSGVSFRYAFTLAAGGARGMLLDAQAAFGDGVNLGSGSHLIKSYMHDCDEANGNGVNFATAFTWTIDGCVISNNTDGISGTSGSRGLIKGNTFKDNDNAAIFITTANSLSILNNIFDDDLWSFVANNGGTITETIQFDNDVYNSGAGGDHSWDNKVSEVNTAKGPNDITGDPVLAADFTVSSGSNVLSAAKQLSTDVSSDLADYKENIGVDQDDNAGGGATSHIFIQ